MEHLKNFLAIIGFIKFTTSSFKYLKKKMKQPSFSQKIRYYFYHKNTLKYIKIFSRLSIIGLLFTGVVVFSLIWLKFNLSMQGFYLGFIVSLLLTSYPISFFKKMYQEHKRETDFRYKFYLN